MSQGWGFPIYRQPKRKQTTLQLESPPFIIVPLTWKSGNRSPFGSFPFPPEGPAQVHSLSRTRLRYERVTLTAR